MAHSDDMITSFEQYYDKVTNLAAPGYEDSEILLFLNNAQDNFIKERLFGDKFRPPAFEDNQKRVADLRPLVKHTVIASTYMSASPFFSRSYICQYPDDLMFLVDMEAKISRTEPVITKQYMKCDFVKLENSRKFDTSPFNKPHFKHPKYYIEITKIYLIFDAYTVGCHDLDHPVKLRYIKKPKVLAAGEDCSLEDYTHQEIVDMAVRQAMQVSQDQRFETKVIEEKNVKTQ
jgi:hypothetical protein